VTGIEILIVVDHGSGVNIIYIDNVREVWQNKQQQQQQQQQQQNDSVNIESKYRRIYFL
jgi:hypothetical protein